MGSYQLLEYKNELEHFWITNKGVIMRVAVIGSVVILFSVLVLYDNTAMKVNEYTFRTESRFSGSIDFRWTYNCIENTCKRELYRGGDHVSFDTCNMLCGTANLWPMPSKVLHDDRKASNFDIYGLNLESTVKGPADTLLKQYYYVFQQNIANILPDIKTNSSNRLHIRVNIKDSHVTKITLETEEDYELHINKDGDTILADVLAKNFFGARHGLETLSQLIWWDDLADSLKIIHEVIIIDKPAFPYRGLMIDTARNYFSLNAIKRSLIGMAANKLNVFHWHITDSTSFPLVLDTFPELANNGAYSKNKIYTLQDVKEIIDLARVLGIRVLIEIDAPSHMYSGWKDMEEEIPLVLADNDDSNGQLNPENPKVYKILEGIYKEILNITKDEELFHIGGDEVNLKLWSSLKTFKNQDSHEIWNQVLTNMSSALNKANHGSDPKYKILWSSPFTANSEVTKYLDKKSTIVQFWWGGFDTIKTHGYKIIFSNVDAWYLDCGFGAWSERRNPNCDPYRTWQKVYKLRPWDKVDISNAIGGEVCMWSEQIGEASVDTRVWPRAAAFAERAWNNPASVAKLSIDVYRRLERQRTRMKSRGVDSEVLWPEFCFLNPSHC